jgi:hypothetical protein
MKNVLIIAAAVVLVSCSGDKSKAYNALRRAGYTDITVGGFTLGCGKDDNYANSFNAKALNGETVSGVVCSGGGLAFTKGTTIRTFD